VTSNPTLPSTNENVQTQIALEHPDVTTFSVLPSATDPAIKNFDYPKVVATLPCRNQAPGRSRHLHRRIQRLSPETERASSILSGRIRYAKGVQVRTIDGMIDWLRELWKLHEVFAADPVTAKMLAAYRSL
jgi:hypothetical protein